MTGWFYKEIALEYLTMSGFMYDKVMKKLHMILFLNELDVC